MDISVFRALCGEMADSLQGLRLVDVGEDGRGGILLTFKGPSGGRVFVLIYSRPDMPRVYMLRGKPVQEKKLTPSVQAIRNLIAGLTVESVVQDGLERTVTFRLSGRRQGGDVRLSLIYEMAGKKPNLIVLDSDGRVEAALSYASLSDDGPRPLLTGLVYEPPPRPDKLDPADTTQADIERMLASDPDLPADKALFLGVWGISPLLAREALALAGDARDPADITHGLRSVMERTLDGPYSPRIYDTPKRPVLAAFELAHLGDAGFVEFGTMSEAATEFYARLDDARERGSLVGSLTRGLKKKLDAVDRRITAIESDMSGADRADEYAHYGNLLMASPGSVSARAESVTLRDLFAEDGREITIPLDPSKTAVENAERYFKLSRKARQGGEVLAARLAAARAERDALMERMEEVADAQTVEELRDIAGRGRDTSAGRTVKAVHGGGRVLTVELPHFVSSDGYDVYYGKNAKQNDTVTFRFAGPMDLWFHAQGYHGAHVVVRNPDRRPDIPLATILEAAGVAAYYSKARKDKSVPVDYTFRKYVRKPRDPLPGQAIFTNSKTVFVDPVKPG